MEKFWGFFSCYFCRPKHDYAVTVAVCSLHKDMFSVLKEREGGKNLRLKSVKWMKNNNNSNNNKKKPDYPSLAAWFHHSNSGLLMEVEEDDDRFSSPARPSSRSPLAPSHYPSSTFLSPPPLHPILSVRQSLSDDPAPPSPPTLLPSQPAEPERLCVCVSVSVCVCLCV